MTFERQCFEPNSIDNDSDLTHHYEYDIAGNLRFDILSANWHPKSRMPLLRNFGIIIRGGKQVLVDPNGVCYSQVLYGMAGLVYMTIDPEQSARPERLYHEL